MMPNHQLPKWLELCLSSATLLLESIEKYKLSYLSKVEIFVRVVEEDFDHRDVESMAVFKWYRRTESPRLNARDE